MQTQSLKIHFQLILQKTDVGIFIDQPGFSTSVEGCWQQNGINTQSQPEAVSKALKDTQGTDNKSLDLIFNSEICQVDLKHTPTWFLCYKRLIGYFKRTYLKLLNT